MKEKQPKLTLFLLGILTSTLCANAPFVEAADVSEETSPLWPPVTPLNKPWAYWYWQGSAVDETNLVRELRRYSEAGMGGMHVVPIYGAKGWEARYLPYLCPRWMDVLGTTVAEAQRLGMGIDMTTGTGWNFGGPNITPELSCLRLGKKSLDVPAGTKPDRLANHGDVLALLAESSDGTVFDLTDKLTAEGDVDWTAPEPGWRLSVTRAQRGRPEVERAAPGGEGPMLNPLYSRAMDHYLARFEAAFANRQGPKPRSMCHDSYEYHGTAWSPDLYEQFARRRGYHLEAHRAELFGTATNDVALRVRADYRETLSDLLLESMAQPWGDWSHRRGFLTRNQAHGSPGNLLDLYAAADIPETEMYFNDRDVLVSKFASSAAHVVGRELVAAETGTWVAEHFTETLEALKRNVDDLFLAGVNHVFYQGTCYSPDEASWPGWLFYASTQLNPRNSIWRDVPALNAYVQRCQSLLQAGRSDNDVLLYWPIHDLWHHSEQLVNALSVHHREWLHQQHLGRVASLLWARGWGYDYISDRQLAAAKACGEQVEVAGGLYRTIVVPACERMPVQTLDRLLKLASDGVTIIFENNLPQDVPGLGQLEDRRKALRKMSSPLAASLMGEGSLRKVQVGRGGVVVGEVEAALQTAGLCRETLVDLAGLGFVRRADGDGHIYYLLNKSQAAYSGWVPLAVKDREAALLDPMTGQMGHAASCLRNGQFAMFLQLQPGQALFVRTAKKSFGKLPPWTYTRTASAAAELGGNWKVEFILGGPELPPSFSSSRLASWAELGGEAAQRFAGTARYSLSFDAPTGGSEFLLSLGRVAQSARVRLNGRGLGTIFMPPFQVRLSEVKRSGNVLELEVTSVAANRIRELDRRGVKWKIFHDINIVSISGQPFDASNWPLHDAGLLGPVTLQPVVAYTSPE